MGVTLNTLSGGLEGRAAKGGGMYFVHPTAIIDAGAEIGEGTRIWHFAHVRGQARIGRFCNIGKGVYVEGVVGNHCKLQNNVNVYEGVTLGDFVFVGPNATFTNDRYPKAYETEWTLVPTTVESRASIGAGAVIRCGVTLHTGCMVGAGCVVTADVPAEATVVGVPGREVAGYAL